ncbi:MAG TPA: hypothetical protein VEB87_03545 [Nitrososphaerales archaeon]|nr:hypothetical protein [Nitrososphaerales archaeon]
MEGSAPEQTAPRSSFGEKLFDARCKVLFPSQQAPVGALAEVWSEGLLIMPDSDSSSFIAYTELGKFEAANYRASLTTDSGTVVVLSQLGMNYDQLVKEVTESWGDAMARALLMEEPKVFYEAPCYLSSQQQSTQCRARIYETALVVLPYNGIPVRFPFSEFVAVTLESYKVRIATRGRGIIELSRLGDNTQFFVEKLREATKSVEAASIETIRTMIPSAGYDELQKLSRLMIEGRAACRPDVEAISPDLWPKLEKCVELSPVADSYSYLAGLAETSLEAVGLRKSKDQVYVWFMLPLSGRAASKGNVVALEVTSEGGHATYLFRVLPRGTFRTETYEGFVKEAAVVIHELNEAIIATGFRREPIYLSEDQLNTPQYSKYLYASKHLDSLRHLRERFVGRIIHVTFDQWKADLTDALNFNATATDDSLRWAKSELDLASPQAEQ